MAVKTLKMTNAPDASAHQQLMQTWKKWKKWLWTIAESQSDKSLMMLAYRLAHAMKFFWMFWVWNAWQHNMFQILREFLGKNNTATMPQPPYSPDMVVCVCVCVCVCDCFLFPKIKRALKCRRFTAIDDIKRALLKELKAIPKIECDKCFEDWKKRWHRCIISNGNVDE